jgi:hypothetical protein
MAAVFWTRGAPRAIIFSLGNRCLPVDVFTATEKFMVAVIGNMIAGLGVVSLFAATLRLTKPVK